LLETTPTSAIGHGPRAGPVWPLPGVVMRSRTWPLLQTVSSWSRRLKMGAFGYGWRPPTMHCRHTWSKMLSIVLGRDAANGPDGVLLILRRGFELPILL